MRLKDQQVLGSTNPVLDLNATYHAQMPTGPAQWLDRPRSIAGEGVYGPQIQGLAAARSGYEEIGGIAWRRYKETKLTQIFRLQIVSSNPSSNTQTIARTRCARTAQTALHK